MSPAATRWSISDSGIEWNIAADKNLPHVDYLEMSGLQVSLIVDYGVNADGSLLLKRHVVWPQMRTIPNNTHASFQVDINENELPLIMVDGQKISERPQRIRFDGVLSLFSATDSGVEVCREIFPCVDSRAAMERISVVNVSDRDVKVAAKNGDTPQCGRGCNGVYVVESRVFPQCERSLAAGETLVLDVCYSARLANEPYESLDSASELLRRRARVAEVTSPMILETGIPEIDMEFFMAKIRAGESIFKTRTGLMHSPGGRSFYAATWCNDQVEYAGPWFAFIADKLACEASLNAYRHYMPFMGPDYKAIPSSVIAEGLNIWDGKGDRGDAAMYAYGASRFALALGDRDIALELWPAIEWTLEYCRRNLNSDGVVNSDTDELEERLPSGSANLCTSSLYYGGLRSASHLAVYLNLPEAREVYSRQADELEKNIENFFGREMRGFATYRYYDGNDMLRSWICIPLCMGIFSRVEGTIDAMFSEYLWTEDGMRSQENDTTFWDRSTLYGLRGALAAGSAQAWEHFKDYSSRRLLGEHVPYPVEAYPESNQRHLSAESALYCRVITEGLLGMEPVGLDSFKIDPFIPEDCDAISLRNVRAFGIVFDLRADREGIEIQIDGEPCKRYKPGDVVTLS